MRELSVLEFCRTDSLFFDITDESAQKDNFTVSLPSGWEVNPGRDWTVCRPPQPFAIPEQGWKIHISATLHTASDILRITAQHLTELGVMFKFLRSESVLRRRSAKNGDRTASGKFITIYPKDDQQTEALLHSLEELVGGLPGPYILSDLRWKKGPLYVRYGAFVWMWGRDSRGVMVPSLKNESGVLVPDERRPVFRPPAWIRVPDFLREAVEARNAATLRDFPYKIDRAMRYSNGGGVYRATELATGRAVLLREARPFAGVDATWGDAVERLEREHWALEQLRGLPCAPEVFEYLTGPEHHYLARAYVEGTPLPAVVAKHHPYATGDRSPGAFRAYTIWALGVVERIEEALRTVHARGVVFGDLHPANVLLRADGSVCFIDLETATSTDESKPQTLGALGYKAPEHLTGRNIDWYAMAVLKLAVFVPIPHAVPWGAEKARQLVEAAASEFALPTAFTGSILTWLSPENLRPGTRRAVDWPDRPDRSDIPDVIARSVLASATPHRRDRLYPGDPMQFMSPGGGLSFGFGAAGTLWALSHLGYDLPIAHVRWLVDQVHTGETGVDDGFITGRAGIAHALDQLGRYELAGRLLEDSLNGIRQEDASHSFSTGTSGVGLSALAHYRATGEERWLDVCADLATSLEKTAVTAHRPGLLNGRTGPALFLLHLHRITNDPAYMIQASEELERDLTLIGTGERLGPGLDGAGGMSMVLDAAMHAGADQFDDRRAAFVSRLDRIPTGFGLWSGRCGTIIARSYHGLTSDAHLRSLGWNAIASNGTSLDFIGDRRFRLSTDLATGSVGALLALASARDSVAHFPLVVNTQ
ncbi:class III lanthionine synthetase LanKC [Streptomyces sp. DSM 41014]|uniref:Class III lanthionine synthetase LanKC n=1 Tax=Streptomyces hintoniae TaxID=3075521 RepID=A0ABU2UCT3_9ACTN|nr:class III lanthionine synthetase LanKC [Streptomyces sp. DSM 41014]MDT0471066.1 class III lanthionine synthetase LanKC [Streptomyces sp. DSM 41014]